MPKLPKPKNPFTPTVRRFLLDVFKPAPTLGKRGRDEDDDEEPRPQLPTPPTPPACVALQNEDTEEDVIVITALNVVPFCCHADLITMNRAELLVVANTLNAKLPHALQIDVSPSRSDTYIRNAIELLVGLRRSVPQAPKPIRSHSLMPDLRGRVPPSPASPLAMRSRSNVSIGSPALAMLREEDEDVSSAERPQKKRRLESRTTADEPTTPKFDLARRITRSQANRIGPILTDVQSPIQKTRVLRTRSQKLPERKPLYESAHANITTVRGGSGQRGRERFKSKSTVMTSTPKKRKAQTAPSANRATVLAPEMVTSRRKKPAGGKATAREVSMEASEVTFGIDGLTITAAIADSCSDMDISLD